MLLNFFSKEPITPRQLLALVLPALLIGLALRASLMWVLTEGYFGSDSNSYYDFSQKFFDHGRIHLSEKRR